MFELLLELQAYIKDNQTKLFVTSFANFMPS